MIRRFIESRLAGVRRVAVEALDGLDDRSKLFKLELAQEQGRLVKLVLIALGALIVSIVAVVWAAATLVAFTWYTEWRIVTLVGLLVFWLGLAVGLALKARSLLQASSEAFRLSRQVAADDVEQLRETFQ